jgi:hypothetical protein
MENSNELECVINQPDDKINDMIHQIITPNERKNVINQPDNSDQNVENIFIQQDDNIYVIIQQVDNTTRLWQCYHPAYQ